MIYDGTNDNDYELVNGRAYFLYRGARGHNLIQMNEIWEIQQL